MIHYAPIVPMWYANEYLYPYGDFTVIWPNKPNKSVYSLCTVVCVVTMVFVFMGVFAGIGIDEV